MSPVRALLCIAGVIGLSGCERPEPATASQLRARAAFELACPADRVLVVRIDDSTGGAVGCGRRVVYVQSCDDHPRCSWRFDREASPAWAEWSSWREGPPPYSARRDRPDEWRTRVPPLLDDDPGF